MKETLTTLRRQLGPQEEKGEMPSLVRIRWQRKKRKENKESAMSGKDRMACL